MTHIKPLCTCTANKQFCDHSGQLCALKETRNPVYPDCDCGRGVNCDFSCGKWARPPATTLYDALKKDCVNHPVHYGGQLNIYEAIKVIEAWKLDFCLGNTIKYISRAGKKDPAKELEDLEKAAWYLNRRIEQLKGIK